MNLTWLRAFSLHNDDDGETSFWYRLKICWVIVKQHHNCSFWYCSENSYKVHFSMLCFHIFMEFGFVKNSRFYECHFQIEKQAIPKMTKKVKDLQVGQFLIFVQLFHIFQVDEILWPNFIALTSWDFMMNLTLKKTMMMMKCK